MHNWNSFAEGMFGKNRYTCSILSFLARNQKKKEEQDEAEEEEEEEEQEEEEGEKEEEKGCDYYACLICLLVY